MGRGILARYRASRRATFLGFCAAAMWPIIISLALNSMLEHHGAFAGILITGIIGGAIWPLIIGSVGDVLGLRAGMLLLFISLGYILSVGFWAKPLITNKTIWDKKNPDTKDYKNEKFKT